MSVVRPISSAAWRPCKAPPGDQRIVQNYWDRDKFQTQPVIFQGIQLVMIKMPLRRKFSHHAVRRTETVFEELLGVRLEAAPLLGLMAA